MCDVYFTQYHDSHVLRAHDDFAMLFSLEAPKIMLPLCDGKVMIY